MNGVWFVAGTALAFTAAVATNHEPVQDAHTHGRGRVAGLVGAGLSSESLIRGGLSGGKARQPIWTPTWDSVRLESAVSSASALVQKS